MGGEKGDGKKTGIRGETWKSVAATIQQQLNPLPLAKPNTDREAGYFT